MQATKSEFFLIAVLLCASLQRVLSAHEGHAPLPTRGASVDVKRGHIVLSAEAHKALGVQTAEASLARLDEHALAYATLTAPWDRHQVISARISGRIAALKVTAGQRVRAGDVLAEIASPELEIGQGDLLGALNELDLAKKRQTQIENLTGQQVSPERDLIEAQVARLVAENAVQVARSKLLAMGLSSEHIEELETNGEAAKQSHIELRSPLSGTVMHTDLAVGKVVEPFEHLFEVVDTSVVWVRIGVLERDLPKIAEGQRVVLKLNALPDQEFSTAIQIKTNHLDPVTHLSTVWGELRNEESVDSESKFLPGMTGIAAIQISSDEEHITLPKTALITQGADRYVLVEEAATKKSFEYQKRSVVVLRESMSEAQISDGSVFPGDRVVTLGSHILSNFFIQGVLKLSPEAARNAGLRLSPAGLHSIDTVLVADGEISLPPGYIATATAHANGTLDQIHIDRGQRVQQGQVIAEVGSLELQSIQLQLLQAELEIQLLEGTYQRLRDLDSSQVLARRRLWETENLLAGARNRRGTAYRQLMTIGLSQQQIDSIITSGEPLQSLPVRAPISGSIVDFNAVLGQAVRADQPLFEIHDLSKTAIQVFLTQQDAPRIHVGAQARVYPATDPDHYLQATVVRSSRSLGADDRTLAVWLELEDQPETQLQNGALMRAVIQLGASEPKLAVASQAIAREGTRTFVFVQGNSGRFERRSVTLGLSDDRFVEIVRGVAKGEVVAVNGVSDLQTAHSLVR